MQRITIILKSSEAMAVRKAVCMAGAECVVIMPMSLGLCATDLEHWCLEQPETRNEVHVRLEVTANEIHHGGIISAIRRVARAGRIVLASHHDGSRKCAACNHNQLLGSLLP